MPSGPGRGRAVIAAAAGPVLGGYLIDRVSWRYAFLINLPLAAVALFVLYWGARESRDDEGSRSTDWLGAALCTLGLLGVVFGLLESSRLGFSAPAVLGALVGGAALLALFLLVEARGRAPMVPLELFRSRPFSVANLLTPLLYAALGGTLFFLPFNLIELHGYSATAAGAALLPFVAIVFLLSRWAGALVDRYGPRGPLVTGPLIAAAGFALLAYPNTSGHVLRHVPARRERARPGHGGHHRAAHHHGDEQRAESTSGRRVRDQQRGVARRLAYSRSRSSASCSIAPSTRSCPKRSTLCLYRARSVKRSTLSASAWPPSSSLETRPARLRQAIEQAVAQAFLRGFRVLSFVSAGLAVLGAASAALFLPREPSRPTTDSGARE